MSPLAALKFEYALQGAAIATAGVAITSFVAGWVGGPRGPSIVSAITIGWGVLGVVAVYPLWKGRQAGLVVLLLWLFAGYFVHYGFHDIGDVRMQRIAAGVPPWTDALVAKLILASMLPVVGLLAFDAWRDRENRLSNLGVVVVVAAGIAGTPTRPILRGVSTTVSSDAGVTFAVPCVARGLRARAREIDLPISVVHEMYGTVIASFPDSATSTTHISFVGLPATGVVGVGVGSEVGTSPTIRAQLASAAIHHVVAACSAPGAAAAWEVVCRDIDEDVDVCPSPSLVGLRRAP